MAISKFDQPFDLVNSLFDLHLRKTIGFCMDLRCISGLSLVMISQRIRDLSRYKHTNRQTNKRTNKPTNEHTCKNFYEILASNEIALLERQHAKISIKHWLSVILTLKTCYMQI